MTQAEEVDNIEEDITMDLATASKTQLQEEKENDEMSELDKLQKIYKPVEIIKKMYGRVIYLEGELKARDAEVTQQRNEIGRMRQILDGYVRDKHKHSDDVKKDSRNRHNLESTAIFGNRPGASTPLILLLIVVVAFLAFLVLMENPNFTSGLHSIEMSQTTELMIVIGIIAVAGMFIFYQRYRHR